MQLKIVVLQFFRTVEHLKYILLLYVYVIKLHQNVTFLQATSRR